MVSVIILLCSQSHIENSDDISGLKARRIARGWLVACDEDGQCAKLGGNGTCRRSNCSSNATSKASMSNYLSMPVVKNPARCESFNVLSIIQFD